MAKILLIETATEVCSVAIAVDGLVVALAEDLLQSNHVARITLLIDDCVQQSGISLAMLDAVAISRGPGSYTSLRVGVSSAKGICYALDKPLIAVDTLLALAWASRKEFEVRSSKFEVQSSEFELQTSNSKLFIPMLDARRQEVWTAVYDAHLQEVMPPQPLILQNNLFYNFLQTASESAPAEVFVVLGNGAKKIGNDLIGEKVVVSDIQNCSAQHLAGPAEHFFKKSEFQDISYLEPHYMKLPNITTPNKPLF